MRIFHSQKFQDRANKLPDNTRNFFPTPSNALHPCPIFGDHALSESPSSLLSRPYPMREEPLVLLHKKGRRTKGKNVDRPNWNNWMWQVPGGQAFGFQVDCRRYRHRCCHYRCCRRRRGRWRRLWRRRSYCRHCSYHRQCRKSK